MDPYNRYRGSSFVALLRAQHPELLPRLEGGNHGLELAHGTTICAARYAGGVLIGGDRRATMSHLIVNEDVTKVFKVDDQSAVAIAGAFGPSVKMVRLFQVELEHYEKIEGVPLTLDGKANKLSQMLEANFPAAIQGIIVMPLYVGFDHTMGVGQVYEYDITGGIFSLSKEEPYACSGSGGDRARTTYEHFWREDMNKDEALELMEKALLFAAKRDTATGSRGHVIMAVSAEGVELLRGDAEDSVE